MTTRFSIKKKYIYMVLKLFILPEMHFKANFFSPLQPSLTHPTTQPRDYQDGGSKRAEWGLIEVKNQVDFKIHFKLFQAFLEHVFFLSFLPLRGCVAGSGPLMENSIYFFLNYPLRIVTKILKWASMECLVFLLLPRSASTPTSSKSEVSLLSN